jgi:hypothetical protein
MLYFITEDFLKSETPITANCDITDVSPWIKPAAETRLKPILGGLFYSDLLAKYNAKTLNGDEENLVLLVQPCVAWRAAGFSVYALSRQLKNKGIQIQNGDNSDGVTLNEVTFGMDHYNQIAGQYEYDLKEFIIENKNLFPVFISNNNKGSRIKGAAKVEDINDGFNDSIMIL